MFSILKSFVFLALLLVFANSSKLNLKSSKTNTSKVAKTEKQFVSANYVVSNFPCQSILMEKPSPYYTVKCPDTKYPRAVVSSTENAYNYDGKLYVKVFCCSLTKI